MPSCVCVPVCNCVTVSAPLNGITIITNLFESSCKLNLLIELIALISAPINNVVAEKTEEKSSEKVQWCTRVRFATRSWRL